MIYRIFNRLDLMSIVLYFTFTLMLLGHNLFDRKVLFLVFCIYLIANIKELPYIISGLISNFALISVLLWCALSATWSQWPFASIEETLIQTLMFLTCLLISNLFTMDKVLRFLFYSAITVVTINFAYIIVFFNDAISPNGMRGIYNHKNNFGLAMALCSMFILFNEDWKKRKAILFFLIISVLLLMLSLSKTSIILFFISLISGFLISKSKISSHSFFSASLSWMILLIILFSIVVYYRFNIMDYIYYHIDDDFLTGRGKLWLTMLLHAEDKLISGFGFNSVWGKGDWSEIYDTDLYLHNPLWVEALAASDGGYIDLIISIGIIGLFLFLFYTTNSFLRVLMLKNVNSKFFMITTLTFILLHNVSETTFLLSINILWFLFILITNLAISKTRLGE
ncbi:O-antigen ligase family protein [Vibrio anguillarum]|uniref:O-antigen ligase family protein n=1 Tax=Vibrio anguillarum TaxID=55601 RepID=UPI00084198FF|nr:O-antigen ligase family protein [Vibrio anguillarum]MBT2924088.1 O-antigen ligase family protein [Vibrio anguillarum]